MIENIFWTLISRKFADEASKEDLDELDKICASNSQLKSVYDKLVFYWSQEQNEEASNTDLVFQKVKQKLDDSSSLKTKEGISKKLLLWASSIAAILVIGFFLGINNNSIQHIDILRKLTWNERYNARGIKSKITLPDGSVVWLNSESKLMFPNNFDSKIREISLSGEAFFDVVKDPSKPFIIHLKNGDVKVLGTSFNIKAFESDEITETSVATGKVKFFPIANNYSSNQKDSVYLLPNDKAVYFNKTGILKKEKTDANIDKSWVEGKLVFSGLRFEEASKILERTYNKKVKFLNPNLLNCKLTAVFENNTLEEVMFFLAKTKDYTYSITDNEVIIDGDGCQ